MLSLSLRLSLFYIAIFLVIGTMLPYWPVWLKARGLGAAEIGILTAVPIIGKLLVSPFFASLGDKLGHKKRLMLILCSSSLFCFSLFYLAHDFWAIFIVSLLYGMSWAPIMSFGDNITLLSTRGTSVQYGRLRLWGSISFIVMSFGVGQFLAGRSDQVIYLIIVVAIFLTLCAILLLPDVKTSHAAPAHKPIYGLVSHRPFIYFMACVAFIHGSHAIYYAFATLHWRSLGLSDGLIGFLWAEGVIAEVIFFIFGARIAHKISPATLLLLGAIGCVVRWTVLGFDPNETVIILSQLLHALTFGAMHLGAMQFISSTVSVDKSATAQSLYGASAFGAGAGLTLLGAGQLYEALAGQAFFVMTLMGIFGTLCALLLMKSNRS